MINDASRLLQTGLRTDDKKEKLKPGKTHYHITHIHTNTHTPVVVVFAVHARTLRLRIGSVQTRALRWLQFRILSHMHVTPVYTRVYARARAFFYTVLIMDIIILKCSIFDTSHLGNISEEHIGLRLKHY